ncbi:hypothetical protein FRC09_005591 [Ceratobasidium sp. 395]|nr:hypothetical protein FRC09_005591 [Ceratobasidium sp. 395]
METNSPPPSSPGPAEPLDLNHMRARMIEECQKRTGHSPHPWQLDMALDMLAGKDTLTIAPTGAGKSLTFALIPFVMKSMVWVVAPLNVIQEQQMATFNDWEVNTLCVNASTNLEVESEHSPKTKENKTGRVPDSNIFARVIFRHEQAPKRDKFERVGRSPTFRDCGRGARHLDLGRGLQDRVRESGNLRAILYDLTFAAVTATATRAVKETIIKALHLGSTHKLVERNLGSYRDNIEFAVYLMEGGLTSFEEITRFFVSPDKVKPSFIFTDSVPDTVQIVDVLRDHLGWTGDQSQKVIAYHSLRSESAKRDAIEAFKRGDCLILVATEALTMGANFKGAALGIQFGAPDTPVTHAQRLGRLARGGVAMAKSVMMVTPNQHKKALALCQGVADVKPDDFVDVKEEEGKPEGIGDDLGDMLVEDSELEDEPEPEGEGTSKKK